MGQVIDALTRLKNEAENAIPCGKNVCVSQECVQQLLACLEPGKNDPPFVTMEITTDGIDVNLHYGPGKVISKTMVRTDEDEEPDAKVLDWGDEDIELALYPELVESLDMIDPDGIHNGLLCLAIEVEPCPSK